MKCLSVRQPYAWAIIHGGKDTENREWATTYRGPLLIQAAKTRGVADEKDWLEELAEICSVQVPEFDGYARGAIIGLVQLVDCVRDSKSLFANADCWHLVLSSPLAFRKPIEWKGQLGIFEVPDDVVMDAIVRAES